MEYAKHLPSDCKSWFQLYEAIKDNIRGEDIYWMEGQRESLIRSAHAVVPRHKYSVRYIEQQALAELAELRALKTFSLHELEVLDYAMERLTFYDQSTRVKTIAKKVCLLLESESIKR